jgi:predicted O-methyltransferase YrrM
MTEYQLPTHSTVDWCISLRDSAEKGAFTGLAERPVNCIEVGVYEGGGAVWLLQNVLVHPRSRYVGLDPWRAPHGATESGDAIYERAKSNLAQFDSSRWMLGRTEGHYFFNHLHTQESLSDLIIIDGIHHAFYVLRDAVAAWPWLHVGGLMVFDDYIMSHLQWANPPTAIGVDAFLATLPTGSWVDVIEPKYQRVVRKLSPDVFGAGGLP